MVNLVVIYRISLLKECGEVLELWARKALECCKQSLIGHSGGLLRQDKGITEILTIKTVLMRF